MRYVSIKQRMRIKLIYWKLLAFILSIITFKSLFQINTTTVTKDSQKYYDSVLESQIWIPQETKSISLKVKQTYRKKANDSFKFFKEMPGYKGAHYDARYFKQYYNSTEIQKSLLVLFESFSNYAENNDIMYWIAHGSLLGWHWGSKIMPWDTDLDIQLLSSDLQSLYLKYKESVAFEFKDKHFLFEINPHVFQEKRLNRNYIDARWIDMDTGIFIDLTGLHSISVDDDLPTSRLSCKNNHVYLRNEIFPLVQVKLNGIETWRPFAYTTILQQEYGVDSIIKENFRGYKWIDESDFKTLKSRFSIALAQMNQRKGSFEEVKKGNGTKS